MNYDEIVEALSNRNHIQSSGFELLHEISAYINNDAEETVARELVLRALDKKDAFGEFRHILDAFTRQVGLFPYLTRENLNIRDLIAYELHRPTDQSEIVFNRVQAEVFRRLDVGENVILSAPTSFGKSRILDAIISTGRHKNIAVVVPTIALIDETRRRLAEANYEQKIVTQVTQRSSESNIFVFTAERLIAYPDLPQIDFFVIDEFYKIDNLEEDDTRTVALNQAFYRLFKGGGQFYLLGPSIRQIPTGVETRFNCTFIHTDFSTVVTELHTVDGEGDDTERLKKLAEDISGQTLIYCQSPKRANEIVESLVDSGISASEKSFDDEYEWLSNHFHPEWIFQRALKFGIGLHHGRLPRSLGQYIVREFNEGHIKFLVCTSTLIEGVNTSAKNVIVVDRNIGNQPYNFFTFNNIRGRSGRMFQHFIGNVYLFNQPPQEELPLVDFPVFTQGDNVPESLLIQMDEVDLNTKSKNRIAGYLDQSVLPIDLLKINSSIDPADQITLAEHLWSLSPEKTKDLIWSGRPAYKELDTACRLIWQFLTSGRGKSGVFSGPQLTFKAWDLMKGKSIRERVENELIPGQYAAKSANEAVERIFSFDRNWAGFELPRLLMALSTIQDHVFTARFSHSGDYSYFAHQLECLFRNPSVVAMEEYGLPIQIGEKLTKALSLSDDLDEALDQVRKLEPSQLTFLSRFERDMLQDLQAGL
ncbi:MAG: helicase-related protein [Marinobacter sp.]|uniref:helicase-related protein n=1 Tax=Marinobacter TaxID=2742 RepID=UPI001BD0CA43|nr:helicase-related protein [Marinobacter lipolyticus]MBS8239748.1 helicase [Marinobacter lipolyticus]